ncbi:MAG: tyrosine-type recombinase/integrase [Muribaculaceae bacterium]|nr:tyrosine-type recombinase/integrase [Muribaculaceae bacterium]
MAKKIFAPESLKNKINNAIGFKWPKVHRGKKIFVDFSVFNPARNGMQRIKKHFDNFTNKKDREKAIAHYVATITQRLLDGWNPLAECGNKGLTTIDLIFEKYETSLSQYSRKKTESNYKSRLHILKKYISEMGVAPRYVYQLDLVFFISFLDWLLEDREVGARTRNNYKGWCTSFCNWLVERGYLEENPASEIPKIREDGKTRRGLTRPELKMLFSHLEKHDKFYLLACYFEYFTMIRPTELSHLRISDINIKNQCVYVSGEFSKNRRDGAVALNKKIILLMVELNLFTYSGDCYIFGKNFKPSVERCGPDQFNKKFAKIRKALKFTDDLQFYSLKDSGIRDLANEKGIVTARDQARHTDISTTNKYLQGREVTGPSGAKEFDGGF